MLPDLGVGLRNFAFRLVSVFCHRPDLPLDSAVTSTFLPLPPTCEFPQMSLASIIMLDKTKKKINPCGECCDFFFEKPCCYGGKFLLK